MRKAINCIVDLSLPMIIMLLILSACSGITENYVVIDDAKFKVEIADERNEWILGLSYRKDLAKDAGMLFVFPEKKVRSFRMNNTWIPLDIIFIDDDFEIVNVEEAQPCEADPCQSFESSKPVRYVLEINGGLAEELGIYRHDKVKIYK